LNITFLANSSGGRRVVPCRWTNRHDEAEKAFIKDSRNVFITFTAAGRSLYLYNDIILKEV
jgi:hypothetical protein